MLMESANRMIGEYFGVTTSFDILICRGSWEMEVQVISRKESAGIAFVPGGSAKLAGMTDYGLGEIVIRLDKAKFGHYVHELVHGILAPNLPHQLREGLAWYFTLKLTEGHRYAMTLPPSWVEELYVNPVKKLAGIVGNEFLKDFALGKASVEDSLLPADVRDLFLPEEVFYAKRRYGE